MKILDCTLRDGGYYTNWDFADNIVDSYIEATNRLPIDYLEIGYRNNPSNEYMGKFGYTPVSELRRIRLKSEKKLALMLNEKSVVTEDLDALLNPILGLVDMIRIAIDPKNIDRAIYLAEKIKEMGFEVGFNVMYMSKWQEYDGFLLKLKQINGIADLFCMVDSYGGISPKEVKNLVKQVKENTTCPIGFHGHNNLQLGLINTLTAIECGVDFVDATILGMGRGAGNLNMELLLTYLNKHHGLDVDFNVLGDVIMAFTPLMEKYQWGTNLPYMLSGANSIPQKEVMDWICNRTYSFNNVVRALNNKKENVADNAKYPLFKPRKYDNVIIIGGGANAEIHTNAIKAFIEQQKSAAVVFASARYADLYKELKVGKYYCLVGSEAKRLERTVGMENFEGTCILSPYPRTMGTEVPSFAEQETYELQKIIFTDVYTDSCTAVAIQAAMDMTDGEIYLTGYDGYLGNILSEKEVALTNENTQLFKDYNLYSGNQLKSLTPTLYSELNVQSVYQLI